MEMAMIDDRDGDYVGYCSPPKSARFQKGQSGNPAGRTKGSKNRVPTSGERLRSLMLKEAYRPITLSGADGETTMPMAQAVLRSLTEAAAKGEARAQDMFLKMVSASELEAAAIEKALEEARMAAAGEEAKDGAPQIEIVIVDPVDGSKIPYRPPGGRSEPKTSRHK
jgi:hypothetical protein